MNHNRTLRVALSGIGEVAVQQHVPAISALPRWELAATCSRSGSIPGIEAFTSIDELLSARSDIDVVACCQPPAPRLAYALAALAGGRHVLLEKPPGATLSQCRLLQAKAQQAGLTLYTTWHSREADMVEQARAWLAGTRLQRMRIQWREDVRRWHHGQQWIWEPGGFGVMDPGINALSIITRLLQTPVQVIAAQLSYPSNRQTPIAASVALADSDGAPIEAEFDWRETGEQIWQIEVETDAGELLLSNGGAKLSVNGVLCENTGRFQQVSDDDAVNTLGNEYRNLYQRMATLIDTGRMEVDLVPLELVADIFLVGERIEVPAFHD